MAKSFKGKIQEKAAANPTLQFISQREPEVVGQTDLSAMPIIQVEEGAPAAMEGTLSRAPQKAPPARRANPRYEEETKSRRLQLLLTPSLYEAIKGRAAEERVSINELINTILKSAVGK